MPITPSERELIEQYGLGFEEASAYIEAARQQEQAPRVKAAAELALSTAARVEQNSVDRVERAFQSQAVRSAIDKRVLRLAAPRLSAVRQRMLHSRRRIQQRREPKWWELALGVAAPLIGGFLGTATPQGRAIRMARTARRR